jgi:hypothetical protein
MGKTSKLKDEPKSGAESDKKQALGELDADAWPKFEALIKSAAKAGLNPQAILVETPKACKTPT